MKNIELQSEFKNVVIENNDINFGLSLNSIGFKSLLSNGNSVNANKVRDFRYKYKKGKVSDEFKLIYITNGVGFICLENSIEIEISTGMILLIYPQQKYSYYHLIDIEWKEYFVRFEADNEYSQMIRRFFSADKLIIDIGLNEELVKLFNRGIDVVKNGLKTSQVYLSGMLFYMLGLIISKSQNKTLEKKHLQQIEQSKIIFNENICSDLKIEDVAAKLNLSYTSFRMNFKKYTGVTPAKYFTGLKIEKAKQLLLETPYSIKEVSYILNFSTSEHFSTRFKKVTGIPPKDYRMNKLQNNNNL
ncbi:MAG: AraC family transcriptional regulator [Bacteroidetes bacterium]|nr:AraC family transcriptional regulator [Bacteroidota bacterium]